LKAVVHGWWAAVVLGETNHAIDKEDQEPAYITHYVFHTVTHFYYNFVLGNLAQ